jgi:hypothetical protein
MPRETRSMVAPVTDPGKLRFMQKKCCDATKRFAAFFNPDAESGTNLGSHRNGSIVRCFQ